MKTQLLLITLCSLSKAAYISRMATVNRLRSPSVFRPGVMLQRPWIHQRLIPAASLRVPYVFYRSPVPYRYALKPYGPGFRNVLPGGPWKTGRIPPATTSTEYEFTRAAPAPPMEQSHGGTGAIHTIPAPNLSLSEKPIVVVDTSESVASVEASSEAPKATYEVTEKYSDPPAYQVPGKIEPLRNSKKRPCRRRNFTNCCRAMLQYYRRNTDKLWPYLNAKLSHSSIKSRTTFLQGMGGGQNHQDLLHTSAEGIIIPPSALYQPDPHFLENLQNQLMQQFPVVEFIPYAVDQSHKITQTTTAQPELFLLENEVMTNQGQNSFIPSESHRNIVQRETQEGSVVSLTPQVFSTHNITENLIDVTTVDQLQNSSIEFMATSETETPATTFQYEIVTSTEEPRTTPIYYAQVGQSVGNVIAKGFYSALNDVRAAAALAHVEKPNETDAQNASDTNMNTKLEVNIDLYKSNNQTNNDVRPMIGSPFEKPAEPLNIAYTLLKTPEEKSKVNKGGDIITGQLVQAMISEDRDYSNNKDKSTVLVRRPPLRLYAMPEKKPELFQQKMTVVKAKIPPKTKLTFDDKTGEPILRIYANYNENPLQKEVLLSKLSGGKHYKDASLRKQETDIWKAATMKSFDKTIVSDVNQLTQYGLKLRSRSDDYIPLFEEYEE